jgi:hypothetical protein
MILNSMDARANQVAKKANARQSKGERKGACVVPYLVSTIGSFF